MNADELRYADTWMIMAAFNEASVIGEVLDGLAPIANIVVTDDKSTDDTVQIVRDRIAKFPSLHLLRHPINLGPGAAMQTGIRYALDHGAKYMVTFDADGQHLPESIPSLLAPLIAGEADVTLGSRFCAGGSAENISPIKKKFLWLATQFTKAVTGMKISDTHNGLRGYTAHAASLFSITQNRMAHATQLMVQIRRHNMRYREIPVRILYTEYSVGKGQKMSNAINIVWESFTEIFWN